MLIKGFMYKKIYISDFKILLKSLELIFGHK